MAMEGRSAKLRRLDAFKRKVPHVSASALSAILEECSKGSLPDVRHRKAIKEATWCDLEEITPYGSMLLQTSVTTKDLKEVPMLALNQLALLYKAYRQGGSFTTLLSRCLQKQPATPESPYRLIMYTDEVTPGNVLSHSNKLKICVFYFSFLEFGPQVLQKEDAWLCCALKRSVEVSNLSAGVSQMFAAVLRLFFGELTFDLSTGGVALESPSGAQVRFFAGLGMVLQDGGAHKAI